jgi:hypothetical protein
MTTQQLTTPPSVPVLASTVLTVVMRVAGPVPTHVHPYAIGEPEQQVTARIGDALVYLTEPAVAGRIYLEFLRRCLSCAAPVGGGVVSGVLDMVISGSSSP